MSTRSFNPQVRRRLAFEAARLLADDPGLDPDRARRKAAGRMGVGDNRHWPSNAEVLAALAEEQRLFRPRQPDALLALRRQALTAMRRLTRFRPRLVGPVLDGSADRTTRVRLHLFAETPDEVLLDLWEQHIPWEQRERWLRYADGSRIAHPAVRFVAGGVAMELVVLPLRALANPPLSPVSERPERGADADHLARLLEGEEG
jgi:hypothetical protein